MKMATMAEENNREERKSASINNVYGIERSEK